MRCLENDRKSGTGGAMKKIMGVMQLRKIILVSFIYFYPKPVNTRVLFVQLRTDSRVYCCIQGLMTIL